MLANRRGIFGPSPKSTSSNSHSMNSSFSSDYNWESSSNVTTPRSTTRMSFSSVKHEDTPCLTPSPSRASQVYGNVSNIVGMSTMTQDMMSDFSHPNLPFGGNTAISDQDMMSFHNMQTYTGPLMESFEPQNEFTGPSMDLDVFPSTPSSHVSLDCVIPSQTTLLDNFDMQSPMRLVGSLQFDHSHYDSSASEYDTDFSFGVSPTESFGSFNSSFSETSSTSTTPSRQAPIRQPNFEPLKTSSALHRVQQTEQGGSPTRGGRMRIAQKRAKRDRNCMLPTNIRYEKQPEKQCPWKECGKKFKRQEHLKRHERTHYEGDKIPCPFCPKDFPIGRIDNLKSHIRLHAAPYKKSSRTNHFPAAAAYLAVLNQKSRPRKTERLKSEEVTAPKGEARTPKPRALRSQHSVKLE